MLRHRFDMNSSLVIFCDPAQYVLSAQLQHRPMRLPVLLAGRHLWLCQDTELRNWSAL